MTSDIVAASILATAIFGLSLVLFLMHQQRKKVRAEIALEREERKEKEVRRKLSIKERQAGHMMYAELFQAAVQNKVVNLLPDGELSRDTGPIEVERVEGARIYVVIVSIPDPTRATMGGLKKRGYPLFQVSICLEKTGKEIHVFRAPHGPERDYSAAEFDDVLDRLYEYVQKYRLFTEPKADDSVFQPEEAVR